MLNIRFFTGIDNQHHSSALLTDPKTGATPLRSAMNCDIDLDGYLRRRAGFASVDTGIHRNLWQAAGFLLATKDGDLINVDTGDVLYPSLSGSPRTWFTNLPDGRTTFSNGLICGITDGTTAGTTKWGVPLPAHAGAVATTTGGSLKPGRYKYQVTHVRTRDGLEGGPTYGGAFDLPAGEGSVVWTGLPVPPAGHTTNVYLSSHDDDGAYLADATSGTTAAFAGPNENLQLACKTDNCYPAPAGICTAFWRGRTLLASGSLLIASVSQRWELFNIARDFKQFSSDITLVQPVDGGIWVGTGDELAFLAGTEFDKLVAHHKVVDGPVALGSGVEVEARNIKGPGQGPAMLCLADGYVTAGMGDGSARVLTDSTYRRAEVDEVVATFRMNGEIPQYIAIPQ
jgi:hypothetical protein